MYDQANDDVLIHVRYWPNSDIMSIDKLPPGLTAQAWRDRLVTEAPEHYQTFAGGRGFFRLPRQVYDNILTQPAPVAVA
jgi:hypothetical protein